MITIQNLSYRYDSEDNFVLKNINLEIRPGEHIALIGPNGCGKTTLIRHLNALFVPLEGSVLVDDMDTSDRKNHKEIRRLVGMLFQNPDNQIVGMTVEEDVAFGPENLGLPPAQIRRSVDGALAGVGMEAFAKRAPHTLSGGEKRLVSIAGVLAMNPRYIALDEPTAHLDTIGRKRVLAMIRKLHQGGIAVIHITHTINDVLDADRLIVMEHGAIVLDGPPASIFNHVDIIEKLGIELPEVTLLLHRLEKYGCAINTNILTLEEACEEILSRMNHNKPSMEEL